MRNKQKSSRGQLRGLAGALSKYLLTSNVTRHVPMRAQGTSITTVLTSSVNVIWGAGIGANGIVIPEHPGRSLPVFGASTTVFNTEWASLKDLFDEFKVEAVVCEYQSTTASPSVGARFQLVGLCDYDNEATAGSYTTLTQALKVSTARLFSPFSEHQLIYKPQPVSSLLPWQSTSNTTARGCIYYLLNSDSGTDYINIGTIVVKHIVKFRNANG